jgi:2-keto-4-pentenoate hydratase/2-oxohepta-3-ene-1,7-dioic acid hydratase in catechol pathway
MKLVTFRTEEGLKLGILTEKGVLDASEVSTIEQVLDGGEDSLAALTKAVSAALESNTIQDLFLKEDEIQLGPCVPNPGKIICVGLNYRKHAEESNMQVPKFPILFSKFNNTIAATEEMIKLPYNSQQVDYEAELGIIIGKRAQRVEREEALDYVFGYCAANDLSARDLQFRTNQWLLGKSCDGFSPIGPYLVTADEIGNPNKLDIRTYVNGEIRQNSNTADMVFYCDELVSYISEYMTLEPGDLILTGTPEGVIMGYPPDQQIWLKNGDEIAVEIEHIGVLRNRMWQEIQET